jgi:hypothetical protein
VASICRRARPARTTAANGTPAWPPCIHPRCQMFPQASPRAWWRRVLSWSGAEARRRGGQGAALSLRSAPQRIRQRWGEPWHSTTPPAPAPSRTRVPAPPTSRILSPTSQAPAPTASTHGGGPAPLPPQPPLPPSPPCATPPQPSEATPGPFPPPPPTTRVPWLSQNALVAIAVAFGLGALLLLRRR